MYVLLRSRVKLLLGSLSVRSHVFLYDQSLFHSLLFIIFLWTPIDNIIKNANYGVARKLETFSDFEKKNT